MRAWVLAFVSLLCGCNSNGTQAQSGSDAGTQSGGDATIADAGSDAEDASEEADAPPPCVSIVQGNPFASDDCIFAGTCPAACAQGTSAAYACNAASVGPDAGAYPSAFAAPSGIVSIVGYDTTSYPWDAAAWVSCGPLACVRWATADHVDGGSTWPADPCGTADAGQPLAWVCPPVAGLLPAADAGCVSAGDMNAIGGGDAGVPTSTVWCCPGVPGAADGGTPDSASGDTGAAEAGAADATSE